MQNFAKRASKQEWVLKKYSQIEINTQNFLKKLHILETMVLSDWILCGKAKSSN